MHVGLVVRWFILVFSVHLMLCCTCRRREGAADTDIIINYNGIIINMLMVCVAQTLGRQLAAHETQLQLLL